jgi:rSAM/selenodomain-associated transferase 1
VSASVAVIVLAKAPVPGRVKTRCCPPCTPQQAAALAEAALADTLAAVAATPARRRVLVLDGEAGPWLPAGVQVVAQRGAGLDERLAAAFDDVGGPALLIGMDTPQVTSASLGNAACRLMEPGIDAVLGPAADGGFWAVGLRRADPRAFLAVPMSRPDTGARQLARLRDGGRRVALLDALVDVDDVGTAEAVAREMPSSRFAAAVAAVIGALAQPAA